MKYHCTVSIIITECLLDNQIVDTEQNQVFNAFELEEEQNATVPGLV